MALKGMESWDIYDSANITDYWQAQGSSTIVAGAGRCSSAALFNNTVGGDGPSIGVSTTNLGGFVAFAHKPGIITEVVLRILNLGGLTIVFATVNADGSLSWFSGPNEALGVRLGTTPANLMNTSRYDHMGFEFSINGVSSYLKIYVNAVLQLTLTGAITFGGFITTDKAWRAFQLVHPSGGYIDDVYWGDADSSDPLNAYTSVSQLGDMRIQGQVALADADSAGGGTFRDFTCSAGTDHGAMVDQNPPDDDTTYNASSTVGQKDTYKFPALAITSGNVYAVQNMPNVKKSDPGSRSIANLLYEGATLQTGANQAPPQTDYVYLARLWAKNPRTSANFTAAQVNAAEHGIEVTA